jgi:hypothetical protein
MDTTSVTHPPAVTQTRRRTYVIGACSTAIAVGGALWAVLKSGTADKSQLDSLAYVVIATLIVGVVVFAWLVPSRIAAGGTGLPLALVSVPLLYAFWSGIPLLVGVAAILIGTAHRQTRSPKPGRALASVLVGSLVAVLTVAAILFG